jgi:hypothetical protein
MTTDAPAGYEWKHVKLPRERTVHVNQWRECVFLTSDMREAICAVLVPTGEPVVAKLDKLKGNR